MYGAAAGLQDERFFRHPTAIVETSAIGDGTRIWAFAHILPRAKIGANCNICDHTFIENDVILGDRVTVQCGVQLWDGIRLEDDVWVGPNVTFASDPFPRGKHPSTEPLQTIVKRGASIGANATILSQLTIGARAIVGAGAVVTRNVPADAIVAGNPATITGYVGVSVPESPSIPAPASTVATEVRGVSLHTLPHVDDMRGALTFAEAETHIPFPVKRLFFTYDIPSKEVRGEHAHRTLHQFLMCVHGSCSVIADDGENRSEFQLTNPTQGIYLPPLTWSVQYKHSRDVVLLVLASAPYNADDYIRDYAEFMAIVTSKT